MKSTRLTRYRNDTAPFQFVMQVDGVPVDITDCTVLMTVSETEDPDYEDSDGWVWRKQGTITDAAGGAVEFEVRPEDVDRLGAFWYDVELTNALNEVATVAKGPLLFVADITANETFIVTFEDETPDTPVYQFPLTQALVEEWAYEYDAMWRTVDTRLCYNVEYAYDDEAVLGCCGGIAPYHRLRGDWRVTVRGKFQNAIVELYLSGMYGVFSTPGELVDPERACGLWLRYDYDNVISSSVANAPGWWWVAFGAAPSTGSLMLKAWPDGQSEPDWQLQLSDMPMHSFGIQPYIFGWRTDDPFVFALDRYVLERL